MCDRSHNCVEWSYHDSKMLARGRNVRLSRSPPLTDTLSVNGGLLQLHTEFFVESGTGASYRPFQKGRGEWLNFPGWHGSPDVLYRTEPHSFRITSIAQRRRYPPIRLPYIQLTSPRLGPVRSFRPSQASAVTSIAIQDRRSSQATPTPSLSMRFLAPPASVLAPLGAETSQSAGVRYRAILGRCEGCRGMCWAKKPPRRA